MNISVIYLTFFLSRETFSICCVFHIYNLAQFGLGPFQVLCGHMWLLAAIFRVTKRPAVLVCPEVSWL
jgi:hypothetical protein